MFPDRHLNCRYIGHPVNKSLVFFTNRLKRPGATKRLTPMSRTNFTRAAVLSLIFFARFQPLNADFRDCAGKLTSSDRQHCEDMLDHQVQAGTRTSQLPGGWRLVKTPDPRGGPEAVSVLHAADTARSDANLAGLTFRCGQTGIETLLFMLEPLVRGSRYDVLVKSGSTETHFEAKALLGGVVLLLPPSATSLASGSWQAVPELSVDIAGPSPIRGSVPVGGLSGALSALSQNCPAH
jgi:hypothetical protein